jgi:hypothetical protein
MVQPSLIAFAFATRAFLCLDGGRHTVEILAVSPRARILPEYRSLSVGNRPRLLRIQIIYQILLTFVLEDGADGTSTCR